MIREKVLRLMLFLAGVLVLTHSFVAAAEQQGIISKVSDGSSCFLRFPAIQEETLYWPRPVLKDPSSGDIISFYGPCDHDPLGPLEIFRQRDEYRRRQHRLPGGD